MVTGFEALNVEIPRLVIIFSFSSPELQPRPFNITTTVIPSSIPSNTDTMAGYVKAIN